MTSRTLTLLGSTGSIGTQALRILRDRPSLVRLRALTAHRNWRLLAEQANEFRPDIVGLSDPDGAARLKASLVYDPVVLTGREATEHDHLFDSDVVMNALVGFAGFIPTMKALNAGCQVALANKESLVVGGELIRPLAGDGFSRLVPIDSEHSAMLQCILGEPESSISKIIITASGGPFRTFDKARMATVTPQDALKHPNWTMGAKITIDSATLMNKGLEIIEAHWLFGLPPDRIIPVIHPQSIIHSVIEFTDGSSKAQLGPPDMSVPILYALTSPGRIEYPNPVLDWQRPFSMTFEPVDHERFPCLGLALEAISMKGFAPAILNAANEIAVQRFLNGEIRYIDIPDVIEAALNGIRPVADVTLESLVECDRESRDLARTVAC